MKGKFSVIVLTETWADEKSQNKSLLGIPRYVALNQTGIGQRRGEICVFIRKEEFKNQGKILAKVIQMLKYFQ